MRKSSLVIGGLLSCTLSLPTLAADMSSVVATVNGTNITLQDYYGYVGAPSNVEIPVDENIVNNMINRELVVQNAHQEGLDKDATFTNILNNMKYSALFDYAMQKHLQSQSIPEEDLRAEHENFPSLQRHKLRQIFVPKPQKGQNLNQGLVGQNLVQHLTKELKAHGGKNFIQLAAQYSVEPMARCLGGDLGWLTKEDMLPEVAKAVADMQAGTFTYQPIESKLGWHFILVESIDTIKPIQFNEARGQLMTIIHDKMAAEYYQSLRAKAKVEIK